ncbi:MAG: hypothetical protein VX899_18750 [Myxococcota bacterium]|nr:hypothetical protein [Myxococcota bacterium]
MNDILQTASALELGDIRRHIPLDGNLPYPAGGSAKAHLVQSGSGVWLIAQAPGRDPIQRSVAGNPTLRLETRMLGDRLHLDGQSFGIPFGRSQDVRLAIGAGRVFAERPVSGPITPVEGVFCDPAEETAQAWLRANLEPEERVLAWLSSSESRALGSEIIDSDVAPVRYLLTSERALLVIINEVADRLILPLPREPLGVEEGGGRREIRSGHQRWTSTRTNVALYRGVAELQGKQRSGRLRSAAQANHGAHPQIAAHLLGAIGSDATPVDGLITALFRGQIGDQDAPKDRVLLKLIRQVRSTHEDSFELLDLLQRWSLGGPELMRIVKLGVDDAPESAEWFLALHRAAHQAATGEGAEAAAADLALAEHLLLAGRQDEALVLLEDRFASLPDEQLSDLLPPLDADLTEGQAGQALRIRTLELLAAARGDTRPDLPTVAELARLQPLVSERLQLLVEESADRLDMEELNLRATQCLALFKDLSAGEDRLEPTAPPPAFDGTQLEMLRHPAARSEGTLSWLQGWLARQKRPDAVTIKNYCERLSPQRHKPAVRALTQSVSALGLPGVEAYISHGELAHGLRAYHDDPHYLLIGGAHLYDEDADYMRPAELRFAVGAEMAHIRFEHTRVTSGEVWDGTVDKLSSALDIAATALTLGSYAPVGKVLESKTTHKLLSSLFSPTTLQRIYKGTDGAKAITTVGGDFTQALKKGADGAGRAQTLSIAAKGAMERVRGVGVAAPAGGRSSLGVDEQKLIVAHRVMQLTADRVGLVLCGDIRSAVRALFLSSARYLPELAIAEEHGLDHALQRRDSEGRILHQDLAIRVGALISFYLSAEYEALRTSLAPKRAQLGSSDLATAQPLPAGAGEE